MKKTLLIFCFCLYYGTIAFAQTCQPINHNDYSYYSLTTTDNVMIYLAKGIEGYMGPAFFIKMKVPYNWGNIRTGCVKYLKKT
ncbi:MAG: hypothetical protein PHP83_03035 [Clostridia bacterium]|nr:hypothetical protein [Clostridia bacterium]